MAQRPKRRKRMVGAGADPLEWVRTCARLTDDRKAERIVILDLREFTYVTDFFLLASATNPRQLRALRDRILNEAEEQGLAPLGVEGSTDSGWILVDFDEVVIHLFTKEARNLYDLELLWGDAPKLEWQQDA